MSEHIESVNKIARLYRENAEKYEGGRREAHIREAESFEAVSAELVRLYGLTAALPPDLGNVFDLPQELLEELSIAKSDELEDQIATVINAYGGTASLDQILVGLYRKFRVTQKRRFLQNKLYRMTMIWSVPGKKGVYTTEPLKEQPNAHPNGSVVSSEPVEYIIGDAPESVEEHEEYEEIPF